MPISKITKLGTTPAITAPVLSGTTTGTYTLGGTPTISSPTISAPVLSGTTTGTYTLGGTPTISSPTISAPVLSGTVTGTYTLGGTPTITDGSPLSVPVGSLLMWPTTTAPTGYLLCNGQTVSRTTYSALFAVLGTTFGAGNGSTTFTLPDYRDRMPIGAGTTYNAASTGGSANSIVVSHTHTATSSVTDPGHFHQVYTDSGGSSDVQSLTNTPNADEGYQLPTTAVTTGISVSTSISTEGASGTNANLPPYLGIHFIIKS